MTFLETPRFPDAISYGAQGGAMFSTRIITSDTGFEKRNIRWEDSRGKWNVAYGVNTVPLADTLIDFFRSVYGRAHGFRFKDWMDYQVTSGNGYLSTTGQGQGLPFAQLRKIYIAGALSNLREVYKPNSLVAVHYDGAPITSVCSVNYTTGIVTFSRFAVENVASITAGSHTLITLSAAIAGLAIGGSLFMTMVTGTMSGTVNSLAHVISSITGATYLVATSTTSLTYVSSGRAEHYPQQGKLLRWAGEFDTPCHFDTDHMAATLEAVQFRNWPDIPIVEIRVNSGGS